MHRQTDMKNKLILLVSISIVTGISFVSAQDSTRHTAIKTIEKTSAQADKLQGKKIQQQTLLNKRVEKLDTTSVTNTKKKKIIKRKRKDL